jgi:uncharacterized protein
MNKTAAASFVSGLVFAVGLGISGMTQPSKVIGFLDFPGGWDPSLALVMVGAIGVHFIAYRLLPKFTSPSLAEHFHLPEKKGLDPALLGGALLFGVGWGLGGFCPGPALVSVVGGTEQALVFTGSMVGGFLLHSVLLGRVAKD